LPYLDSSHQFLNAIISTNADRSALLFVTGPIVLPRDGRNPADFRHL
jgi:hypothetical protein